MKCTGRRKVERTELRNRRSHAGGTDWRASVPCRVSREPRGVSAQVVLPSRATVGPRDAILTRRQGRHRRHWSSSRAAARLLLVWPRECELNCSRGEQFCIAPKEGQRDGHGSSARSRPGVEEPHRASRAARESSRVAAVAAAAAPISDSSGGCRRNRRQRVPTSGQTAKRQRAGAGRLVRCMQSGICTAAKEMQDDTGPRAL